MHFLPRNTAPRREDQPARALIDNNRGVIERLADQLSNGAYSASRRAAAAPAAPQPEGLIISHGRHRATASAPKPYVRISPNRRVVLVDFETGRQMQHLGEIRRVEGVWRFVLATAANGFFLALASPLADDLAALDGAPMGDGRTDDILRAEIEAALGVAKTES